MTEPKRYNIYQRINEVRKAVSYVKKDKQVSAGAGGNYKAVTHDQVTASVRPHLVTHGVIVAPTLLKSKLDQPGTRWDKDAQIMVPASMRMYRAQYSVAFINADDPEDRIVIDVEGHAQDNGDKGPGKALSYAVKYALLKILSLETGEDDEGRMHEAEPIMIDAGQLSELITVYEAMAEDVQGRFTDWLSAKGIEHFKDIELAAYGTILKQAKKAASAPA
jgi:hypothetical protein